MKKITSVMLCMIMAVFALLSACAKPNISKPPTTHSPQSTPIITQPQQSPSALTPKPTLLPVPVIPETTPNESPNQPTEHTFLAYVRVDESEVGAFNANLLIWVDEVLWIDGEDEDLLSIYGVSPDEVDNDYVIVNISEYWQLYVVWEETTFFLQYDQDYELNPREVSYEEFRQYMFNVLEYGILAEITLTGMDESTVLRVEEKYVP